MLKLSITVIQQLDKCGDEFLDEREFNLEFMSELGHEYVKCTIDGKENCFINRTELLAALRLLTSDKISH